MKNLTLILLSILFTNLAFSQAVIDKPSINTKSPPTLIATHLVQQAYIVIDNKKYEVDDFEESRIKLEWIESVSVLNDDLSVRINTKKKEAIFLYPKKKYEKRILRRLENH